MTETEYIIEVFGSDTIQADCKSLSARPLELSLQHGRAVMWPAFSMPFLLLYSAVI